MKRLAFFFCISMWFAFSGFSQVRVVPGEAILMLHEGKSIDHLLRKATAYSSFERKIVYKKCLSQRLNIHLIGLSMEKQTFQEQLEALKGFEEVRFAQPNHEVDFRGTKTTPNDALFSSQWALENIGQAGGVPDADIDATDAWDLATGGLSALGDTLVVAIVDEGLDIAHEDLFVWKNHLEIAGNGKDDDQNGYIDDDFGWNAKNSTGDIVKAQHGTHVAGIAAALGNNGKGVSGVNWNTQVMAIVGESPNEAVVVEAYSYVFDARSRYKETQGREGAFVVVTNSSFGVNNANPVNFPIWCAMYDTLGSLGILNVVSTANQQVNVDNVGDMPSTCASDFVISVTSTNRFDNLQPGSAFGKIHIDLGAPGAQINSTIPNNSYTQMTGTSMAAPHVAGAVALMASGAGPKYMSLYKNYPDSAALILKDRLLQGVDPLPGFDTLTTSGGRLNLFGGLVRLQNYNDSLSDCTLPYNLAASQVTDTSASLTWAIASSPNSYWVRYRPEGNPSWSDINSATLSADIQGLNACSLYEFQVASICGPDTGDFSAIHGFESEGCCRPPANLDVVSLTETEATLTWSPVYAADSFRVLFRATDSLTWNTYSLTDTFLTFTDLSQCTEYEAQIYTRCDTGLTGVFQSLTFTTGGCGFCREGIFCISKSDDATEDWIAGVEVGPLTQMSGSDDGYGDFTGNTTDLWPGVAYSIKLTPGFSATAFNEYWKAWIDYNQDGDFEESSEKIFDSGTTSDTVVTGQFTVPATAKSGPTRLRISMRFSLAPDPCSSFPFGEVEDYCVDLRGLVSNETPLTSPAVSIFPNPVEGQLNIFSKEKIESLEVISVNGQRRVVETFGKREIQVSMIDLASGLYAIRVRVGGKWVVKMILVK